MFNKLEKGDIPTQRERQNVASAAETAPVAAVSRPFLFGHLAPMPTIHAAGAFVLASRHSSAMFQALTTKKLTASFRAGRPLHFNQRNPRFAWRHASTLTAG